jgi:hypothetical protein
MKAEQEKALHEEVVATLDRLKLKHPELDDELQHARGYAVFPSLGRASLVLGGSYGRGEVFEKGKPIGFATLTQITIGVQVGGQTLSEIIFFEDRESLEMFKGGKAAFTANASAVLMKAAASGTSNYAKCTAHAYSRGGMVLEASLGGQKFNFMPPSSNVPRQENGGGWFGRKHEDEDRGARRSNGDGGLARLQPDSPSAALATGLSAIAMLAARVLKAQAAARAERPNE